MAFCIYCGAKLDGAEKFCPNCGKQIAQSHQSNLEQTSKRARNGNSENLAAAVANTKQRSRRKAPLILLIAFALAAVAGTAYAAYTIISKITAPENTQQAQDSAQSLEEAETYVADTKEAAIEAYAKVIADYNSVAGLKESEFNALEHPYIDQEDPRGPSYAYFDLSNDDIPELIIGSAEGGQTGNGGIISDVWTCQNGKPVKVAMSESHSTGYMKIGNDKSIVDFRNIGTVMYPTNGRGEIDCWQLKPLTKENAAQSISSRTELVDKLAWTRDGATRTSLGSIVELSFWENGRLEESSSSDKDEELRVRENEIIRKYMPFESLEWHDFKQDD